MIVLVEVQPALQVLEVSLLRGRVLLRLDEAVSELLELLDELEMVLAHLLDRLHGDLALEVHLVRVEGPLAKLLDAVELVERALEEVVLLLVGEHVHLVQQLVQRLVQLVVLLVQQGLLQDGLDELALTVD